jgi:hypothetical protein
MSKTPSGKKRHPSSFGPFFGGKRICLGKTFLEYFSKIIVSIIITNYEFKFEDEEYKTKKPGVGFHIPNPTMMVRVSKR